MTLLSVADLRTLPVFRSEETFPDAWLQILLDATEAEIADELGGPVGSVTEVVDGSLLSWLTLRRRADSITTIVETSDSVVTTIAADDYRIALDRRSLQRLGTGTNPSARWPRLVSVTYAAEADEPTRKRVQKALVELDAGYAPGRTDEQIGAWRESYQQSSVWNYQTERKAILATLWPTYEIDFA